MPPKGWRLCYSELGDIAWVWSCRTWSGFPIGLAVVTALDCITGRLSRHVPWEEWLMLRKTQFRPTPGIVGNPINWDALSRTLPNLWEFLTQDKWDDGEARETGSLLIFCDKGQLKAMIKDRDTDRCLWISANGLQDILEVANEKIGDENADWRADKGAQKKGGRGAAGK